MSAWPIFHPIGTGLLRARTAHVYGDLIPILGLNPVFVFGSESPFWNLSGGSYLFAAYSGCEKQGAAAGVFTHTHHYTSNPYLHNTIR